MELSVLLLAFFLHFSPRTTAQLAGGSSSTSSESRPPLKITTCNNLGCREIKTHLTMDAERRPVFGVNGTQSCFANQTWNPFLCRDPKTCAKNCALGEVNYTESRTITTSDRSVTLNLFNKDEEHGTRFYLMDSKDKYKLFHLKNQEFSFDIDVSNLPCGVNGALSFVAMDDDGGKSKTNQAGAKYGTGYCGARCPKGLKFVGGRANLKAAPVSGNLTAVHRDSNTTSAHLGGNTTAGSPSGNSTAASLGGNSTAKSFDSNHTAASLRGNFTSGSLGGNSPTASLGSNSTAQSLGRNHTAASPGGNFPTASPDGPFTIGNLGSCCPEMSLWQANLASQAFSAHPCVSTKSFTCQGSACKDNGGLCAASSSCDFASYRWGARNFYGPMKTVDTLSKFKVVTQFITDDGTSEGDLVEIRRIYIQNGKVIQNSPVEIPGIEPFNSLTDKFCSNITKLTRERNELKQQGGLDAMGKAMNNGMVMVMSVSMDEVGRLLWLDGKASLNQTTSRPGSISGSCTAATNNPDFIRKNHSRASVTFSNIRIGDLNSSLKAL